jgi:hypothetical protein
MGSHGDKGVGESAGQSRRGVADERAVRERGRTRDRSDIGALGSLPGCQFRQYRTCPVFHGNFVKVPGADDRLRPGDTVVALVQDAVVESTVKLFAASETAG